MHVEPSQGPTELSVALGLSMKAVGEWAVSGDCAFRLMAKFSRSNKIRRISKSCQASRPKNGVGRNVLPTNDPIWRRKTDEKQT